MHSLLAGYILAHNPIVLMVDTSSNSRSALLGLLSSRCFDISHMQGVPCCKSIVQWSCRILLKTTLTT